MPGIDFIDDLRASPNSALAIERYRKLAREYDASCWRIEPLRALAIQALALQPGERVLDVACGTGSTVVTMARQVGPTGRVLGIEQSPEMAGIARQRLEDAGITHAEIVTADVRRVSRPFDADAVLCSFTHDVLQSPDAIARIRQLSKSGARIAVLGARTLSWWWGWPANLFLMWRGRRYLTTFHGLANPCARLAAQCEELEFKGAWHAGTSYLTVGRLLEPQHPQLINERDVSVIEPAPPTRRKFANQ